MCDVYPSCMLSNCTHDHGIFGVNSFLGFSSMPPPYRPLDCKIDLSSFHIWKCFMTALVNLAFMFTYWPACPLFAIVLPTIYKRSSADLVWLVRMNTILASHKPALQNLQCRSSLLEEDSLVGQGAAGCGLHDAMLQPAMVHESHCQYPESQPELTN